MGRSSLRQEGSVKKSARASIGGTHVEEVKAAVEALPDVTEKDVAVTLIRKADADKVVVATSSVYGWTCTCPEGKQPTVKAFCELLKTATEEYEDQRRFEWDAKPNFDNVPTLMKQGSFKILSVHVAGAAQVTASSDQPINAANGTIIRCHVSFKEYSPNVGVCGACTIA